MKRIALLVVVVATFFTFQSALATNTPSPDTTTPSVYDLENEPPNASAFCPNRVAAKHRKTPASAAGRLQYLVFAIMIAGLTVVGVGITRSVRKRPKI
ncbi:MAG: hypothetical protein EBQ54_02490 [Actinobacteria bacterium]|nr:hypothetical protein [Actinomycetota bacterium]